MMCVSPLSKKTTGKVVFFPCGKCAACLARSVSDLYVRCSIEYQRYKRVGFFFTLTYAPDFLPTNNLAQKSDIQKFFKRFRINLLRNYGFSGNIKYFLVSEHGTHGTSRVHYHGILFGVPPNFWVDGQKKGIFWPFFDSWGMGRVDIGLIRHSGALSYVLKYVLKYKYEHFFFKNGKKKYFF